MLLYILATIQVINIVRAVDREEQGKAQWVQHPVLCQRSFVALQNPIPTLPKNHI